MRRSRWLVALVVLAGLAVMGWLIFSREQTPLYKPLPNPNGYDDFLNAAALLKGDANGASTLDHDGLREFLSTNAEPLRLLQRGLTRQCLVPTESAVTNFPTAMTELPKLKSLVRLLVDEGQLAELENRPVDAARSYTDAIQFGSEISRGGFVIHRLVGVACETMGINPLSKLLPKLNCEQTGPLIARLESIDVGHVKWEDVLQGEKSYAHHEMHNIRNPISRVILLWQARASIRGAEKKHQTVLARLRLLAAEMALRCYQSEQGHAPQTLDQLVPKNLQRMPLDPFSGRPLVYRAQGTNWLLYSIGMDGVDDGGKPTGRPGPDKVTHGDLFFDSP